MLVTLTLTQHEFTVHVEKIDDGRRIPTATREGGNQKHVLTACI